MTSDRRDRTEAGFSLVETIAAMGILALAAIPLMQLVNNSIRGSAGLEHRLLARTVAENVLVQQVTQSAIPIEEAIIQTGFSDQMGKRFAWTLTTFPYQEALPQLVSIEVRMEQSPQILAQLTGVRLPVLPSLGDSDVGLLSEAEGDRR